MIKKIMCAGFILLFAFSFFAFAGGSQEGEEVKQLTLVTGGTAGVWYSGGAQMAEIWNNQVPNTYVTSTDGGSMSNIRAVNNGQDAQIGMTWAPSFYLAQNNEALFSDLGEPKIKAVCNFFKNWGPYWIATEKSGIETIEDFKDKRILPGYEGSGMEYFARRMLEAADLSYEKIEDSGGEVMLADYAEGATLMKDGHIDAFNLVGPAKHSLALEAQNALDITVVGIPKDVRERLYSNYAGFTDRVIEAGTYEGQTEDVTCVGYTSILIVNESMDEELVYQMVKTLMDSREKMVNVSSAYEFISPENALTGIKWDALHPGAQRYFEEIGMKP